MMRFGVFCWVDGFYEDCGYDVVGCVLSGKGVSVRSAM